MQQCRGRHDLAGLAIATLDTFKREPGVLNTLARLRLTDRLDGDHRSLHVANGKNTGTNGLPVDLGGARSALADPATELGAGQARKIAQCPEERHVIRTINQEASPIDMSCFIDAVPP